MRSIGSWDFFVVGKVATKVMLDAIRVEQENKTNPGRSPLAERGV